MRDEAAWPNNLIEPNEGERVQVCSAFRAPLARSSWLILTVSGSRMAHRTITSWLKTWQRKQCAFTSGLAVLAMVVGCCVVLLATFWLAYGLVLLGMDAISAGSALLSGKPLEISHGWRFVLSLLFIVLLFMETVWPDAEPPPAESRPQLSNTYTDLLARLRAELIIVAHPVDSARRISYWLRMGPRCVFRSGRLFCRLLRLPRLRRESLAPVLALLASRSSSVSKQELLQAFPAMQ